VLNVMSVEPLVAVLLATTPTWMAHSNVAVMVLAGIAAPACAGCPWVDHVGKQPGPGC
jgi:hypothetical protein